MTQPSQAIRDHLSLLVRDGARMAGSNESRQAFQLAQAIVENAQGLDELTIDGLVDLLRHAATLPESGERLYAPTVVAKWATLPPDAKD